MAGKLAFSLDEEFGTLPLLAFAALRRGSTARRSDCWSNKRFEIDDGRQQLAWLDVAVMTKASCEQQGLRRDKRK